MTNVPATQEPEGQFERLAARFLGDPAIIAGTGFGANPGAQGPEQDLRHAGPGSAGREAPEGPVDQLVASGAGARFDPGHGRLMKEWVMVAPRDGILWEDLATDALAFVDDQRR